MITHRSQAYSTTVVFLLVGISIPTFGEGLPHAEPEEVGIRSDHFRYVEELVKEGLEESQMPGCVITVGRKGSIVFHKAYGFRQLDPAEVPMTTNTVFDMASITKPVATATSVMMLLERGKIRIRDKVSTYIPEFANGGKETATIKQLLTHQAGFVPDNAIADYELGRDEAFKRIYALEKHYDPGTRFVYSDVGFILLDDLIERQSGKKVSDFSRENIFAPLGMTDTGYLPADDLKERAATTEQRNDRWIKGEVHDPRAYLMDGVAGHAGLFSTAEDLAIYAQTMLNGGHHGGNRILSRATVELMTREYRIVEGEKISIRGLGWDKLTGYSSNRAENFSSRAFGHGGFTGTVLWIDPELEMFFIFLSNRVHPNGKGSVNRLAGRIATVFASAIDDELQQEDAASAHVRTGIDVLAATEFAMLANQRVGLITNQTGIDQLGVSTIQRFRKSPNVHLTALFSPEHGLAGKLDQSFIGDSVDETGLEIFSLYGKSRQPTAEQLASVDTLVFDIQDIGCRFYTYVSTMGLAMQAAATHGKRFVVLDRPNPINGVDVAGPMLDEGRESFVGFHSLPVRHGMTVGELAKMFNAELDLGLDLEVVPCGSWRRSQYFDATGLRWIDPSPNMRSLHEAILYPGIGLWETTNLSVGRGTGTPFEIIGAPWMDCRELATRLNSAKLNGISFTPVVFTPKSSKFAGETCYGVRLLITNRQDLHPIQVGITLACTLWELYPDQWHIDNSMRLLNHGATLRAIKRGETPDTICRSMRSELQSFMVRRAKYLIYER